MSALHRAVWRRPNPAPSVCNRAAPANIAQLALGLSCRISVLLCVLLLTARFAQANPPAAEQPEAAPESPLTASGLAAWAVERNAAIRAARSAAEAAAHRIDPAGSLDDPSLSYGAAPGTADSDRGLNQRVEFSQKLPWPGTLEAREEQARSQAMAAGFEAESLRLNIVALAKAAHAEWRYVAQALEIHAAVQTLLRELITTAETRYAAGRASRQDVLQARVELTELEKQGIRLHRQQLAVQARINALLQRPADAPLPVPAAEPQPSRLPGEEELAQIAIEQHPALDHLSAEITASEREVTLAEKAFYPDFQVGIGYNQLWEDADKRATVGLSISVPLDRSKRHAQLKSAQAQVQRARWKLADQRAQLLADLAEARAQVIEARETIHLYENQLVPLVKDYLDSAISDYSSGSGAFLNVVTAEQRQLSTELGLARARADYARALAALERWVGGSLPSDASMDVAPKEKTNETE